MSGCQRVKAFAHWVKPIRQPKPNGVGPRMHFCTDYSHAKSVKRTATKLGRTTHRDRETTQQGRTVNAGGRHHRTLEARPFLPQEPNFSRSQYLHANCTTNVDDEMKFVGMTEHSQTMNFEARPHPLVPVNGIQRQLSAICSHLRVFSAERCIRAVT